MVQVVPLALAGDLNELRAEIDEIFFESATRKEFASEKARAAFHDLWLGRYLRHCPNECFIALDDDSLVAGYLAGALMSNEHPLPGPDNYALFPKGLVAAYPAHLHVNVRKDCRGQSIGALLIAAFIHHCHVSRVPGLHAITSAGSRSENFFKRCGLLDVADAVWNGRPIVMLARRLD